MNMHVIRGFRFLMLLLSSAFFCDPTFGDCPLTPQGCPPLARGIRPGQPGQLPVSLQETLEMAYMQNADLDAARAGLRATDETVSQANADWRPSLSVVGTQAYTQTYPIGAGSRRAGLKAHNVTTEYVATLAQNIYKGGQTTANIGLTESNVLAGKAGLFTLEQQTLFDAVQDHTSILANEDIVSYQKESEEFNKKLVENAQARYEVGEGSR